MRLPRVRFTVRGMMILVAVVALPIWYFGPTFLARREHAVLWARIHSRLEQDRAQDIGAYQKTMLQLKRRGLKLSPGSDKRERAFSDLALARTRHHAAMTKKYERAARYPWLPVDPDPPEPE